MVIFSDQHKGTRDGADDFFRAERAYCAALAYYLRTGHHLVVLGDAEELWETWSPKKIVSAHSGADEEDQRALDLEAMFLADGRYSRVWGNHDLTWSQESAVQEHLVHDGPFGSNLTVTEGIRLRVNLGGGRIGRLFLVHGHQGTADSQVITPVSRPFVRFFGFLQRRFRKGWNTPANDWKLRARHDRAMFEWAKSQSSEGVVLIAGHTHRPVFWDRKRDIASAPEVEGGTAASPPEEAADRAYAQADARWGKGSGSPPPEDMIPPAYFNTGCCSFADGDVTGLEIEGGQIHLVRWPDDQGRPRPQRLPGASAPLADVFEEVLAAQGA